MIVKTASTDLSPVATRCVVIILSTAGYPPAIAARGIVIVKTTSTHKRSVGTSGIVIIATATHNKVLANTLVVIEAWYAEALLR